MPEFLERWPSTLESLRALEKLLRPPTMRERFQACCIGVDNPASNKLSKWSCSLRSLRWESITNFTEELLHVEHELRMYWNKHKFANGLDDAKHKRWKDTTSGEFGINVSFIDETIQSTTFWNSVCMVHDIAFEAEFIGKWAEGCSCCEDKLISGTSGHKRQRTKWFSKSIQSSLLPCPYKGCRAVQLAAGDWLPRLQSVMSESRSRLTDIVVRSPSTDQPAFVEDWIAARSKLWSTLQIKLAYFNQLPLKICALGWLAFLFEFSFLTAWFFLIRIA